MMHNAALLGLYYFKNLLLASAQAFEIINTTSYDAFNELILFKI